MSRNYQIEPTNAHDRKRFLAEMNRKWERKYKQKNAWVSEIQSMDEQIQDWIRYA